MGESNKVDVVIGGEILTLVSGEREEYMQRLARYIDHKLDEIKKLQSNAALTERTRTLFFALNIADDYFKTLDALQRLEDEHARYIRELGRMQEENNMLNDKLREFQDALIHARMEKIVLEQSENEPRGAERPHGERTPLRVQKGGR